MLHTSLKDFFTSTNGCQCAMGLRGYASISFQWSLPSPSALTPTRQTPMISLWPTLKKNRKATQLSLAQNAVHNQTETSDPCYQSTMRHGASEHGTCMIPALQQQDLAWCCLCMLLSEQQVPVITRNSYKNFKMIWNIDQSWYRIWKHVSCSGVHQE